MAYRSIRISDISGETLSEDQLVTVVVRSAGKIFDASEQELASLKRLTNVEQLELRHANGKTEEILVDKAEFQKLVTAEVLARADAIRGRRSGFSPKAGK